jgi:predicted DNA-binding transcriptional regulator AlpA
MNFPEDSLSPPSGKPAFTDERLTKKLQQFDDLPETAFVDNKVVCAVCDRSPSSIQRDVKAGRLAPPIKIGPNAIRWRVGDVRRFLEVTQTETSSHEATPDTNNQLGHNGAPPLNEAAKQIDPPIIKAEKKKRGAENA